MSFPPTDTLPDINMSETSPEPREDIFEDEYIPEDPCKLKLLQIARESEKCFSEITDFWQYMIETEKISCENLLLDNYPPAC